MLGSKTTSFVPKAQAKRGKILKVFSTALQDLISLNKDISVRRQDIQKEQDNLKAEDSLLQEDLQLNTASIEAINNIIKPTKKEK